MNFFSCDRVERLGERGQVAVYIKLIFPQLIRYLTRPQILENLFIGWINIGPATVSPDTSRDFTSSPSPLIISQCQIGKYFSITAAKYYSPNL